MADRNKPMRSMLSRALQQMKSSMKLKDLRSIYKEELLPAVKELDRLRSEAGLDNIEDKKELDDG